MTEKNANIQSSSVLVVDDIEMNRDMLCALLEADGHKATVAENGRLGLEVIKANPFDLVLLDVMMPEMNGYQVLEHLKSDQPCVTFRSSCCRLSTKSAAWCAVSSWGPKTICPNRSIRFLLRARIGACLEKKRLRDQEIQLRSQLEEWNKTLEQRVQEQVAQLDRLSRLKRFFSPQLAELIVAGGAEDPLKTHRREVTVVFLDLRGFTAFAETAEPEEVMGVLREYHAEMGKLILEHEGHS